MSKDRTQVPSTIPAISQADEFLRRARNTHTYRTEPLPPAAAAALDRLERAFAGPTETTTAVAA